MSLHHVSCLLCPVVLAATGALAAAAAEPGNLAPNPGFEQADPPPTGSLMSAPELRSPTRRLAHELHALKPFLFSTAVVPMTIEGVSPVRSACLAKRVGDAVEVVMVNLESEPVARLQLGVSGCRVREATPMLEPPREVRIEDGQVIDRLPPYGVCLYRLQISGKPDSGDAKTAEPTKRGWWPW